jgi:hypothetical protein
MHCQGPGEERADESVWKVASLPFRQLQPWMCISIFIPSAAPLLTFQLLPSISRLRAKWIFNRVISAQDAQPFLEQITPFFKPIPEKKTRLLFSGGLNSLYALDTLENFLHI